MGVEYTASIVYKDDDLAEIRKHEYDEGVIRCVWDKAEKKISFVFGDRESAHKMHDKLRTTYQHLYCNTSRSEY